MKNEMSTRNDELHTLSTLELVWLRELNTRYTKIKELEGKDALQPFTQLTEKLQALIEDR